jgi:hypothetical protein
VSSARLNLGSEEAWQLEKLMLVFHNVFTTMSNKHGWTNSISMSAMHILYQVRHSLSLAKQAEVIKILKDMKGLGIIKESDSPWASRMLIRNNRDLWFCVDYQWLNNITKDCFLLPRINDILDMLTKAKWFSTLDLKNGYWQVDLHHSNKEKTAFCTG